MNGPDHYREAERLLRLADDEPNLAVLAQVHATLAAAAATATLNGTLVHLADKQVGGVDRAWVAVAERGATAYPGGVG